MTTLELNLSELAWAAGFFDGEGCTTHSKGINALRLSITQVDIRNLERFKAAVLGIGKIYGPRDRGGNTQLSYTYRCNGVNTTAVLGLLWRFLGPGKRDQALLRVRTWKHDPRYRTRGTINIQKKWQRR